MNIEKKRNFILCFLLIITIVLAITVLALLFPVKAREIIYQQIPMTVNSGPVFSLIVEDTPNIQVSRNIELSFTNYNVVGNVLTEKDSITNTGSEAVTLSVLYPYVSTLETEGNKSFQWLVNGKEYSTIREFGKAVIWLDKTEWDYECWDASDIKEYQKAFALGEQSSQVEVPGDWKSELTNAWELPEYMNEDIWKATVLDQEYLTVKRYHAPDSASIIPSYVKDCAENNRIFYRRASIEIKAGETVEIEIQRGFGMGYDIREKTQEPLYDVTGVYLMPDPKESLSPERFSFTMKNLQKGCVVYLDGENIDKKSLEKGISLSTTEQHYLQKYEKGQS